ncbi:CAP domain-containing protein [Cellulosimicrobium sp. TH-20]|uniref:CAP domain-containing protein n=1 Tax=Cellulosimicrobium sp. TH-20 TaxID=1980001 RepID=UPI001C98EEAA
MVSQRTPRHRSAGAAPAPSPVTPSSSAPARRRGGPFARHLRSGPRVAVTTGVVAALLLGPALGLTAATVTGEIRPEHAGPFGPVVAALPWQGTSPQEWLAGRDPRDDRASRTLADARDDLPSDVPTAPGAPAADDAPTGSEASPAPAAAEEPPTAPAPTGTPEDVPPAGEADPAGPDDATATDPAPGTAPADAATPAAGTATAAGAAAPGRAGPGAITAEGAAVVELTNAARAAAGCEPLAVDDRLTAAAQLHSEDMDAQGYMDHTSLDGRSPWDRAHAQGYPNPGAENVAKGYRTAQDVVRGWMDSPGHRANILDCGLREIGVGHANGAWTQVFGRG